MDPLIIASLISAGGGLLSSLLGGSDQQKPVQHPKYTPEQQKALNSLLQMGMGGLETGNVNLGPLEEQARNKFRTETAPGIAEQFTAFGGNTKLGSSPFARSISAAGTGLEKDLNAMKYGQLFNFLNLGLTPQFDTEIPQQGQSGANLGGLGSLLPFLMMNKGQSNETPGYPGSSDSVKDVLNSRFNYMPDYSGLGGLYGQQTFGSRFNSPLNRGI